MLKSRQCCFKKGPEESERGQGNTCMCVYVTEEEKLEFLYQRNDNHEHLKRCSTFFLIVVFCSHEEL